MKSLYFIISLLILLPLNSVLTKNDIIIDSDMTFEEAIKGTKAPKSLIDSLCLVNVDYYGFDEKLHRGQLVINKAVKDDIVELFDIIKVNMFPIGSVIPIVKFNWDDDASMKANNTSAFNYRFVAGTDRLSNHSFGKAIDINQKLNPVMYADGRISPEGASYQIKKLGTFSEENIIVKYMKKRGWRWGGDFESFKDYHHFDKP